MRIKIIGLIFVLAVAGAAWALMAKKGASTMVAPAPNGSASQADAAKASPSVAVAKQIIEITAKDGYSPSVIDAKAGQPVLLRVKTQDTQDCSTGFTIPSFGIQTELPATGVTEFDLPAQKAGETIEGSCQMGMNHFVIKFN